jgi:hypothetical protein
MFRRYEIVDESDLQAVAKKHDAKAKKMERDKNKENTTTIRRKPQTAILGINTLAIK